MDSPDPVKCGCGTLVTVPVDIVERANRLRKTLPANQYGSAGLVKCPTCGAGHPLVVTSRLEPPPVRKWRKRV